MRHTCVSLLIDGGESVTAVADRMGHKNAIGTLHTYSHLWPSSDDKTRRVLDKAFMASTRCTPGAPTADGGPAPRSGASAKHAIAGDARER